MSPTLNDIQNIGDQLAAAKTQLDKAWEQARLTTIEASRQGTPEARIAKTLGVSRQTIRRWLGKN